MDISEWTFNEWVEVVRIVEHGERWRWWIKRKRIASIREQDSRAHLEIDGQLYPITASFDEALRLIAYRFHPYVIVRSTPGMRVAARAESIDELAITNWDQGSERLPFVSWLHDGVRSQVDTTDDIANIMHGVHVALCKAYASTPDVRLQCPTCRRG